jgi:hypothetical protein
LTADGDAKSIALMEKGSFKCILQVQVPSLHWAFLVREIINKLARTEHMSE